MSQKRASGIFKKYAIKLLRGLVFGVVTSFLYCPVCFFDPAQDNLRVLLYYSASFILIWELMSFFVNKLNVKVNWVDEPRKKLFQNLQFYLFIFLPLNLIYVKLVFIGDPEVFNFWHLFLLNRHNALTALIILLFFNSLQFYKALHKSFEVNREIEKKHIEYQLLALKNQTNPHFLFNNLNVLSQLIYENTELAEQFIGRFSEVYRYLLEQKEENLVPIETELEFIEAYIFLVKIRHGENINFLINKNSLAGFYVAPITLQLLIENAIKHNEISTKHPLTISIDINGDSFFVQNNVRPKSMVGYSSGVGIDNIMNRYKLLSQQDVIVEESNELFRVLLPKIYTNKKLSGLIN